MAQQSPGAYPASDGGKRSRGGQAGHVPRVYRTPPGANHKGRGTEAPRNGSRTRGGGLANQRHAAAKPAGGRASPGPRRGWRRRGRRRTPPLGAALAPQGGQRSRQQGRGATPPGRRGPPSGAHGSDLHRARCLKTNPRGRREGRAGRVGQMTRRTAGREALIAPYPRTPAKPAPQGTDRAPLPPAQISCWGREAATGGWGGARPRARRGAGGRARSTGSTGVGPREPGGRDLYPGVYQGLGGTNGPWRNTLETRAEKGRQRLKFGF